MSSATRNVVGCVDRFGAAGSSIASWSKIARCLETWVYLEDAVSTGEPKSLELDFAD